jgi:hypothetical protein
MGVDIDCCRNSRNREIPLAKIPVVVVHRAQLATSYDLFLEQALLTLDRLPGLVGIEAGD